MRRLPLPALLLVSLTTCLIASNAQADDDASPEQIFADRIMPIFQSPKPSSCVQCHLAAVDLKNYILPSHEATFVALREEGLVNLEQPAQSKILKLIRMGDADPDSAAQRIHQRMRDKEYEAFSSWIVASSKDDRLRKLKMDEATDIGPERPLEVVRHARRSRLLDSFERNVWSQRMRCFPCHTPHELDADNPKHRMGLKRHAEFVDKYGARMNIFRETPEETLDALIAVSKRKIPGRYPLINLEDPTKSLLVLKPTAKLPPKKDDGTFEPPSATDPVSHMGGLKMHVNDQSYRAIVAWIQDYSNIAGDRYLSVDELPQDNLLPTQRILKLTNIPADWGTLTPVQVRVYAADEGDHDRQPVAFTQCLVTPRRMAMGPLSLIRPTDQHDFPDENQTLAPGRYRLKIYVDRQNRLQESPTLMLPEEDFVGAVSIDAEWKQLFRNAEAVDVSDVSPAAASDVPATN
jgi:hypothetical protein